VSATIKLSAKATGDFWEIPVLFEDEHLLAVDKPAELLVAPDRYDPTRPNLMRLLHEDIKRNARWVAERSMTYLSNAHRLDFETSGVLLLAKNKPALIELANQFGAQTPSKKYLALARGNPLEDTFEVDAKLAPHPIQLGRMKIDSKNGKISKTQFRVLERFTGYALIECQPLTGRTHQIRIHLRHAGFPIVADSFYGGQPLLLSSLKSTYRLKGDAVERPLLSRVALHAERLSLPHPVTGQPVDIQAPWPKDLTVAVKYLRRYAAR
jgi:23S rRNA pseudouridine1911/1915/1917 synthase